MDSENARLKDKLDMLDNVRRKFDIGIDLYEDIRKALKYETEVDKSSLVDFISELPR